MESWRRARLSNDCLWINLRLHDRGGAHRLQGLAGSARYRARCGKALSQRVDVVLRERLIHDEAALQFHLEDGALVELAAGTVVRASDMGT